MYRYFLSIGLSQALILVHMNLAHNVRITITLFLTYLLRPVPSDVQLFIVHTGGSYHFDCTTDWYWAAE